MTATSLNCKTVNTKYHHGVGRPGAHDRTKVTTGRTPPSLGRRPGVSGTPPFDLIDAARLDRPHGRPSARDELTDWVTAAMTGRGSNAPPPPVAE